MNKNDAQVLVENVHNTLRHYEMRLIRLAEYEAAWADHGDDAELKMMTDHTEKERARIHGRVAQLYTSARFLLPACGPELAASFEGYVGQMCRAHNIAFGTGSPLSQAAGEAKGESGTGQGPAN
jgi:hypothetical protein